MRSTVVRLQESDGTWQDIGTDRSLGIVAEGLQLTSNTWGPDTASFELHRDPSSSWPDLDAFTPVEVEVNNQLVWKGRITETQVQDGLSRSLTVRCEGLQYQLDDDQLAVSYVQRQLSAWQPLADFCPVSDAHLGHSGTIDIGDGGIWMGWKAGSFPQEGNMLGIVLDLGAEMNASSLTTIVDGVGYGENFKSPLTGSATAKGFGVTFGRVQPTTSIPAWNSSTGYVTNNIAYSGGIVYVATASSTNATPLSNPSKWKPYIHPVEIQMIFVHSASQVAAVANRTVLTAKQWGGNYGTQTSLHGESAYIGTDSVTKRSGQSPFCVSGAIRQNPRYQIILMYMGMTSQTYAETPQALENSYGYKFSSITTYGSTDYMTQSPTTAIADGGLLGETDVTFNHIINAKTGVLTTSTVVSDIITKGTSLTPNIPTPTSLVLPEITTDGYKTPRDMIEQLNSYHGWITRVDEQGNFTFKATPTTPLFEMGSWSGYEFNDQAASSGQDIYNRVIVEAQDAYGSPLRVAITSSTIAAQYGLSTALRTSTSPTLSVTSGYIKNPASLGGQVDVPASGVFRAGVTYRLAGTLTAGDPNGSYWNDAQSIWSSSRTYYASEIVLNTAGTLAYQATSAAGNLNKAVTNTTYWTPYSKAYYAGQVACNTSGVFYQAKLDSTNVVLTNTTYWQLWSPSVNIVCGINGTVSNAVARAFDTSVTATASTNAWTAKWYSKDSVVSYLGSSYVANTECYSGDFPGVSTSWTLLTSSSNTVTIGGLPIPTITGDTTSARTVEFSIDWTPSTDQTFGTAAAFTFDVTDDTGSDLGSPVWLGPDGYGVISYTNFMSLKFYGATLADQNNIRRTFVLNVPGVQTTDTLTALGNAWLSQHMRAQFRGTISLQGNTAIRQYTTGMPVHPSRLLLNAGELITLTDRTDPDTGSLGRTALIAGVTYDADTESVSVELDNRRDNLSAFLNRLSVA